MRSLNSELLNVLSIYQSVYIVSCSPFFLVLICSVYSELRLLIDSLLFSKSIPNKQCTELIEKLESLSNCYFKSSVKHICNLQENQLVNKQLFYNIEILDEAISKGKQVKFRFNACLKSSTTCSTRFSGLIIVICLAYCVAKHLIAIRLA